MKKFNRLTELCQSRCFNLSLTWQKMTDWSVEIYVGYSSGSYEKKFYTDGHTKKKEAIKEAIKYMEEFDKKGAITIAPQF